MGTHLLIDLNLQVLMQVIGSFLHLYVLALCSHSAAALSVICAIASYYQETCRLQVPDLEVLLLVTKHAIDISLTAVLWRRNRFRNFALVGSVFAVAAAGWFEGSAVEVVREVEVLLAIDLLTHRAYAIAHLLLLNSERRMRRDRAGYSNVDSWLVPNCHQILEIVCPCCWSPRHLVCLLSTDCQVLYSVVVVVVIQCLSCSLKVDQVLRAIWLADVH